MASDTSPYLKDPSRLADVLAAIQVMASYKFYKLDFDSWADRIVGDRSKGLHWQRVFEEHPEFFRLDAARKKASLAWRRQRQKRYDVDSEARISKEDFEARDDDAKARVSRMPLEIEEVRALLSAAIDLHTRALEHRRDTRWWMEPLIAAIGAIAGIGGAIVGALIKGS